MRVSTLDVPQTRECPPDVLASLAAIDPACTCVHLSQDRWIVGFLSGSSEQVAIGRRLLENTQRTLARLTRTHPNPKPAMAQQRRDRLTVATLRAMGMVGGKVYRTRQPDGALVEQVRRDDFEHRHTTDAEFWRAYDALEANAEAERLADLTDPARANDVWRNQHVLYHSPGVANHASTPAPRSSARTLIKTAA